MTIIFQQGNTFWIEVHYIAHSSIDAGQASDVNFELDRAGFLLAYSQGTSTNGSNDDKLWHANLTEQGNGVISITDYGALKTGLRSRMVNDEPVDNISVQTCWLIYMRGRG